MRTVAALLAAAAAGAFRTYAVPGAGATFHVPASWEVVDAQHVLTPAQVASLSKGNPELAGSLREATQPGSPARFFAFDPQPRAGFHANVNVVVTDIGQTIGFATYVAGVAHEVAGLAAASNVSVSRVRLPSGEAVRASYSLRVVVGRRVLHTLTLQYGFLRGGRTSVIFTYTTLRGQGPLYAQTFAASARSIRFG